MTIQEEARYSVHEYWTQTLIQEDCLLKEAVYQLWEEQEPLLYLPSWLEAKGLSFEEVAATLVLLKEEIRNRGLEQTLGLEKHWLVLRKFEKRCQLFLKKVTERFEQNCSLGQADHLESTLRKRQKEAVKGSLSSNLFILTGGPGTGKTYTCRRIVEALIQGLKKHPNSYRVALLAPTGKAMVRLEQSMQGLQKDFSLTLEAMTLHRFLYTRDMEALEKDPCPYDIVLVDEASMVTLSLFEKLIGKIHPLTRLVLIGDPYQLPPVQSMPVFERLVQIAKEKGACVNLDECLRVENQDLFEIASLILKCENQVHIEVFKNLLKKSPTLGIETFKRSHDFMTALEGKFPWISLLENENNAEPKEAFKFLTKWACLCSIKAGKLGCDAINQLLYERLRFHLFRLGKEVVVWVPVMATVNQKELQRVNGEMGLLALPSMLVKQMPSLSKAMSKASQVLFLSGQSLHAISPLRLESLAPAWAMTIHKSQGSEFDHVECLMACAQEEKSQKIEGKALLYTACTRAKKSLRIWQQSNELEKLLMGNQSPNWLFEI